MSSLVSILNTTAEKKKQEKEIERRKEKKRRNVFTICAKVIATKSAFFTIYQYLKKQQQMNHIAGAMVI